MSIAIYPYPYPEVDRLPSTHIYVSEEDLVVWDGFKRWCEREGIKYSKWIMERVKEHYMVHCAGNNQTLIEYAGLPKTLPRWKTCRCSNKKLVDELFTCTKSSGIYHLSPLNCVYVNGQQKCYRGIPDE